MYYNVNQKTRNQLVAVILIDALSQAARNGWTETEFKAHLKGRLSEIGQLELAV